MKPGKILIVDDFKTNILYLNRLLNNEGYETYSGNKADIAVKMISSVEFDLILLDIIMPDTDGYGLCEFIRKSNLNSSTPVIFITSKKDEESVLKGFELGGQDYVIRPFSNSELLARVNTHIELKRNRAELKSLNEALEKTVQCRTMELKNALAKLKISYKNLKEAQKELWRLDEAKESFLKIINHEIRTPLNGIIGFQELIKASFKDENLINYLEIMQISVNRLEKFSMDALLITQLKAGMYKLTIGFFKMENLINNILAQYSNRIQEQNITVFLEIQEAEIHTDEILFQYTFKNILENAIYHSPKNQTILIRGKIMKGNNYQIQILDKGNGFPAEIMKNKYRLFINNQFTDNRPGLSLYAINLIMRYLKGKMKLANRSEGGASVLFNIKSLALQA